MRILKTKFYPVDIDAKVIHNFPENRERDIASKWPADKIVGIRGDRLRSNKCYDKYTVAEK